MYSKEELAAINKAHRAEYEANQAQLAADIAARKAKRRATREATQQARELASSCGHVEATGNPRKGCDCDVCTHRRKTKSAQQRRRRRPNDPDNDLDRQPQYSRADRFAQYGITEEQYLSMLNAQDYRCAICGTTKPGGRSNSRYGMHIDHDHATGKVRGLLCAACNWGLGQFKDSIETLEAAADYLRRQ